MKFSVRREAGVDLARELHTKTFPSDEWEGDEHAHWVIRDEAGTPVGFCSAKHLPDETAVYFTRAGVLPAARGAGLQRRMINARLAWARRLGVEFVCTYVLKHNYPSLANLIKTNFHIYTPKWQWAGKDVFYLKKDL